MNKEEGIRPAPPPVWPGARAGRSVFVLGICLMLLPLTGVADCTPDETTLCLQNGRFEITLAWTDFAGNEYSLFGVGQSGDARFVKRSEDTGLFWFFSEDNVEGIVRILDGRSVNGHFWLFAAFMTNMDPVLRVEDLDTGALRTYASGGGFPMPILDTNAFADAIKTDVAPPSPRQADALRRMLALAQHAGEGSPDGPNWAKGSLPPTGHRAGAKLVPSCQELPSVLCFDENRFRVEAAWEYDNGTTQSGVASAVSLPGDQSGAFWFFNEDNIEMLVKVLDGRHVNDHFWIFAAGLTNVKTTLVVTDTLTGQSFQRTTYPGYAMPPLYDNEAFDHGWRDLTGVHSTAQAPWSNLIDVFNTSDRKEYFYMDTYGADGTYHGFEGYEVAAHSSTRLVMDNNVKYIPGPDDIILDPVEGWFWILVAEPTLQAKISYQYGDSPSVTEFFLPDSTGWEYVLTNPRQPHFSWFAAAVTNTLGYPVRVEFEAYRQGVLQGSAQTWLEPWNKYARLSDGLIGGLGYDDFDTLLVRSEVGPIPPPISITGNDAQDRHVFFNGQVIYGDRPRPEGTGKVALIDSIVGNLWTVPAGAFLQGQWFFEPCAGVADDRPPFVHELTRDLVVMETEVTRGMWTALRDLQPDLPPDPAGGADLANREPVADISWYEAVLFANLLSVQQGLTPCYYADSMFTAPLTAAYYQTDDVYCDFDADGFRLPTEGEWEYFCRAGTTGPFWVDEPNYHDANCDTDFCWVGLWPNLEDAAVFCANALVIKNAQVVGTKRANPWGLRDSHGNVAEWCWDWYGPYPSAVVRAAADKGAATDVRVTDFMGPAGGDVRIIRGGSYADMPWRLVSPGRDAADPATTMPRIGFRLVRTYSF